MDSLALPRPRRLPALLITGLLAVVLTAALGVGLEGALEDPASRAAGSATPTVAGAKLPLYFVENRGQADPRAAYYLQGDDVAAYFTDDGVRLSLADRGDPARRWGLELDFLGATATPVGVERTPARVSYFGGDARRADTALPTYSRVVYRDLWPGIDLAYSGGGGRLKYSFVVRPGADPASIRLGWRGASRVSVDRVGRLEVSTPVGGLRDAAPRSYQRVAGRRAPVASSYAVTGHEFGFRLGSYDRTRPLVIDPAMLVYAGYIGGAGADRADNVAVDRRGNLYVTGNTLSVQDSFPDRVGPDRRHGGAPDAYVAKVHASGRRLVYAGYIGGDGVEDAIGIAVDRTGSAYVSGTTGSTQATFPARRGPDVTYNGGPQDAFVAKLSPSGRRLVYAGYVGGAGFTPPGFPNEQANGVAVDRAGNAYVAGFTASSEETGFPATAGSFDTTQNGFVDTFVAKVSPSGRRLVYAGFIGGAGIDPGTGLSIDRAGNAYVDGFTGSDQSTFPDGDGLGALRGPDPTHNGGAPPPVPSDAYVAKVNRSGTRLLYAGYIGGSGIEQPFDTAVDRRGNLYVTGNTTSSEASFPDGDGFGRLPGPDRSFGGGSGDPTGGDAFVAKVSGSGRRLLYAGYLGGSGDDKAIGLDVDREGSAYLSGETAGRTRFPTRRGPDATFNGGQRDAFVAKVHRSGRRLAYGGYLGGRGEDGGIGVAVDSAGSAYVSGSTESSQRSFPVRGGPDLSFNGPLGDLDAFVAKISDATCGGRRVTQVGTAGRDRITGTGRRDVIAGAGGSDLIRGLGGNDVICGGSGRDRLLGGRGRDRLDGGSGVDVCDGSGRDRAARCERPRRDR